MMTFYYTKDAIGGVLGIPARSVEKFSDSAADALKRSGVHLERFDPKNKDHAKAPGANAALSALQVGEDEELARLTLEETNRKRDQADAERRKKAKAA